uniref:Uncharacterized protein n=1 Tax=Octopus bimaculoides TaxID=37653 RepID=A0A0L8GB78_OCTBM
MAIAAFSSGYSTGGIFLVSVIGLAFLSLSTAFMVLFLVGDKWSKSDTSCILLKFSVCFLLCRFHCRYYLRICQCMTSKWLTT